VQAFQLPDDVKSAAFKLYSPAELSRIPGDYPKNGFSYIVIPGFSEAHQNFAKDCSTWEGVFDRPLVGWIAGVNLKDLGNITPKVVDGKTGEMSGAKAAVAHFDLARGWHAEANILNLFRQGTGDTIQFPAAGFDVSDCFINGRRQNFAAYVGAKKINIQQPLVANYMGAMVNASFHAVDVKAGKVTLYAPVFPEVEYKLAAAVPDYEAGFRKELRRHPVEPVFTCNCILNYVYANLEGKKTASIVGPITFGEIAYMLLNQTLVYLTFEKD
jgi:hypothetical protein